MSDGKIVTVILSAFIWTFALGAVARSCLRAGSSAGRAHGKPWRPSDDVDTH